MLFLILFFLIGINTYSQNTMAVYSGTTHVPTTDKGVIPIDKKYTNHKEKQEKLTLSEIEYYLNKYNHLPGVQSEKEVKQKGWSVTESVMDNGEKIEELFLFMIEQQKIIDRLQVDNEDLKSRLEKIEKEFKTNNK